MEMLEEPQTIIIQQEFHGRSPGASLRFISTLLKISPDKSAGKLQPDPAQVLIVLSPPCQLFISIFQSGRGLLQRPYLWSSVNKGAAVPWLLRDSITVAVIDRHECLKISRAGWSIPLGATRSFSIRVYVQALFYPGNGANGTWLLCRFDIVYILKLQGASAGILYVRRKQHQDGSVGPRVQILFVSGSQWNDECVNLPTHGATTVNGNVRGNKCFHRFGFHASRNCVDAAKRDDSVANLDAGVISRIQPTTRPSVFPISRRIRKSSLEGIWRYAERVSILDRRAHWRILSSQRV